MGKKKGQSASGGPDLKLLFPQQHKQKGKEQHASALDPNNVGGSLEGGKAPSRALTAAHVDLFNAKGHVDPSGPLAVKLKFADHTPKLQPSPAKRKSPHKATSTCPPVHPRLVTDYLINHGKLKKSEDLKQLHGGEKEGGASAVPAAGLPSRTKAEQGREEEWTPPNPKKRRKISRSVRTAVLTRYNRRCFFCSKGLDDDFRGIRAGQGRGLKRKRSATEGTVDHLVPYAAGGQCKKENYVSACRKCNERKASWWLDHLTFNQGGGFDVPDISIDHLNEFNARVKPIMVYFIQHNLLSKVAGGKYPQSYYAIRDAVAAVDAALVNNPVRRLGNKEMHEEKKDKGGLDEEGPPAKRPRTSDEM